MPKNVRTTLRTYAKNLLTHLGKILRREEAASRAAGHIRKDTEKLQHALSLDAGNAKSHRKAVRLVKAGRLAYNAKEYLEAEKQFRAAAAKDHTYALAHMYVGHALYQQGKFREARAAWQRAYAVDPASAEGLKALRLVKRSERHEVDLAGFLNQRMGR